MKSKKEKSTEQQGQKHNCTYLQCHGCGRKITAPACSWDDDEGNVYCSDCRVERESCGCSD